MKQSGGGFIVLPNSVFVSADTGNRKLGVLLPRIQLPENATRSLDTIDVLFQPNPRDQRTVPGVAKIVEAKDDQGQACFVIPVTFYSVWNTILEQNVLSFIFNVGPRLHVKLDCT